MKPGVAVIGLGIMGTRMLGSLRDHGGFSLITAWDPSSVATSAISETFPELSITSSAVAAMEDPEVDIVYIASPPAAHHEYAVAAAKLGKLVYCEKPLGVDIPASEELLEAIDDLNVRNAVNFPFAATASVDRIVQELQRGALGDVLSVDIQLHFTQWPRAWQGAASWVGERADGGFVREVGSHFIYLTERLFGRASLQSSDTTYPADPIACETRAAAALDCSGIPVTLQSSAGDDAVPTDIVEFTIRGSMKSIRLSDWQTLTVSTGDNWGPLGDPIPRDPALATSRFFDELHAFVSNEPNTIASFEDALSVQRIVEAILQS